MLFGCLSGFPPEGDLSCCLGISLFFSGCPPEGDLSCCLGVSLGVLLKVNLSCCLGVSLGVDLKVTFLAVWVSFWVSS